MSASCFHKDITRGCRNSWRSASLQYTISRCIIEKEVMLRSRFFPLLKGHSIKQINFKTLNVPQVIVHSNLLLRNEFRQTLVYHANRNRRKTKENIMNQLRSSSNEQNTCKSVLCSGRKSSFEDRFASNRARGRMVV
jgi:hypothetical protein